MRRYSWLAVASVAAAALTAAGCSSSSSTPASTSSSTASASAAGTASADPFGTPNKAHYIKQVAAALAFIGLVNNDRVVLQAFNDRVVQ